MRISFAFDTPYGRYSDALVLPDDNTYTNDEIEAMKQARFDAWLSIVSAVPPEETP
jgi:hypothetical protein